MRMKGREKYRGRGRERALFLCFKCAIILSFNFIKTEEANTPKNKILSLMAECNALFLVGLLFFCSLPVALPLFEISLWAK